MEMDDNPLQRCRANSKRSGSQCGNFAMKGKQVCRMHGGKSTGCKTAEGRSRQVASVLKDGLHTKEAKASRRQIRRIIGDAKEVLLSL